MENKLQGCLIGAAIGDSVGLPYEGMSSSTGKKLYGHPDKHKLLFGLGMVSDDTEHLVIVLRSYRKANGDAESFSKILASKLKLWTLALPLGVGKASLISGIKLLFGFSHKKSGIFSAGNGPAMRVSVLGLLCEDNEKLKEFVKIATCPTQQPAWDQAGYEAGLDCDNDGGVIQYITPSNYKVAFKRLTFVRDDGTEVDIIGDTGALASSAVLDITSQVTISSPILSSGDYTSIEGEIYYYELEMPINDPSVTQAIRVYLSDDDFAALLDAPQVPMSVKMDGIDLAWGLRAPYNLSKGLCISERWIGPVEASL